MYLATRLIRPARPTGPGWPYTCEEQLAGGLFSWTPTANPLSFPSRVTVARLLWWQGAALMRCWGCLQLPASMSTLVTLTRYRYLGLPMPGPTYCASVRSHNAHTRACVSSPPRTPKRAYSSVET